MSEKLNSETRAAVVAVTLALGEQLDLDRLITAIKIQYDKAEKLKLETTCSILGEVGITLTELSEQRDLRKKP